MGVVQNVVEPAGVGNDRPGIAHRVCCVDENVAVCGLDVSEEPWVQVGEKIQRCVVCDDLGGRCPKLPVCVVGPR